MSCCPANSEPALAQQSAIHGITTYNNTNLYVTGPATAKAGLLAFPDIYGLDSGRTKADADALGKLGYVVVLVDLTDGDYMTDEIFATRKDSWLHDYNFENFLLPRIKKAIEYLQKEAKVEVIASYGYCWGAWVGARLSALNENVVLNGHVSIHPSWRVENAINGDGAVEKLAEKIKVPQLLLAAGNDPDFVREGGSVEKILKANPDIAKLCDVVDFPDVNHGWVNRGDLENPTTKEAVTKAWHTAITFIQTVIPL